nr:MAG TPA: hypothetical protein [Caudoviricetes sp.]
MRFSVLSFFVYCESGTTAGNLERITMNAQGIWYD